MGRRERGRNREREIEREKEREEIFHLKTNRSRYDKERMD